jgi:hypothetical protein
MLALRPTGDAWIVERRERGTTETIAGPLPLAYAQGAAEDLVRQAGAVALTRKDAPWRKHPATDRQKQLLRVYRIPFTSTITKGEASDLLAVTFAKR